MPPFVRLAPTSARVILSQHKGKDEKQHEHPCSDKRDLSQVCKDIRVFLAQIHRRCGRRRSVGRDSRSHGGALHFPWLLPLTLPLAAFSSRFLGHVGSCNSFGLGLGSEIIVCPSYESRSRVLGWEASRPLVVCAGAQVCGRSQRRQRVGRFCRKRLGGRQG